MDNQILRKAAAAALAGAALVGFSQQASAIAVVDLGTLGGAGLSDASTAPKYAWDGTNGLGGPPNNNGWAHTSKWYLFDVSSPTDVLISMTSGGAGMNSAFSVWKTGGAFVGTNHSSHIYNQIGTGGASAFLAGSGGDTVTAWLGYANSGPGFAGGGGSIVYGGSPGASVTGGNAISTTTQGNASLLLSSLAAGEYLIALGGSCYTDGSTAGCGAGPVGYSLSIAAVPIPAAVWLFGSALMGLGVIGRRKAMAGVA